MPIATALQSGAVLIAALLCVSVARAQERDPAAAQALFDDARALMNARRYGEACPKLAESQRLDPGIGTQFNLGTCYEHEGRLASAWATFLEVASLAKASGQSARAEAAERRAALLEPRLPRLTIRVSASARVSGLEITRDGVPVGEAQWDVALPLDPGEHRIEITAPRHRAFAGAVRVAEGGSATFEVPRLEPVGPTSSAPAYVPAGHADDADSSATVVAPPPPAQEPSPSEPGSGPDALVVGLGIGGLVLIGTGTVLALVAKGKNDDSKEFCSPDDPNACDERGVDLRDDALLMGNLATVGFAVGGAAIAVGGALWLLDDDEHERVNAARVDVTASATGASISWRGTF